MTGFIPRQGKLRADDSARTFSLDLIRTPEAALDRLASELSISASALSQRLQQRPTARFLHTLPRHALGELHLPARARASARWFPGCGGGKGERTAAGEVLGRIDPGTGRATQLAIGSGRTPDVHLLGRVARPARGVLEVTDLGFFDTDRFRAYDRRGGGGG